MQEYKAACRGCHGGCMHILSVDDGKLVRLRPDPDGPLNKGHACVKGMSIIEQMYHPDRIIHPMKRIGERGSGQWQQISWDEAYNTIADKLNSLIKEHGPESIATISGTGRHLLGYLSRFANVIGTPNKSSSGAFICLGPRRAAGMYSAGIFCGVDYYGPTRPGGVLVWGSNPAISGPDGELQWLIKDVVKENIPILVIDPYPTELAQKAEIWLKIKPGTDGALALCFLNIIIQENLYDHDFVDNWTIGFDKLAERCKEYNTAKVSDITGLSEDEIVKAAHWIASTKPLGLEWGPALEQTINANQSCRAILMIPAITGNWDVPGGMVESKSIAPVVDSLENRLSDDARAKILDSTGKSRHKAPFAHPFEMLRAIKTGEPYKVRALIAAANNTLLSVPDTLNSYEALKQLEFFVYIDFFMNPTAELADIFLPAALWPEVDNVYCMPEFGDVAALCMQKVVRVGECKSDEEIFFELSSRMGYDYGDSAEGPEDLLDGILAELGKKYPEYKNITFNDFKKMGYIVPERTYYNYKIRGGFDTPSRKFELYCKAIEEDGSDPLPFWTEPPESYESMPQLAKEYPLVLASGRREQQFFISNNRQIKSLRKAKPFPIVSLNPITAQKYGIENGDWVFIETPRGRITQKCEYKAEMKEDVVICDFGWWYPEDKSPLHGVFESNANVLTSSEPPYGPFGEYTMRGLLCKISKNPSREIEDRYYSSDLAK